MTNRPIDYEHPFARLVPNDIVPPTTEVVKEEEGLSEIFHTADDLIESLKGPAVKEDDIPLPPLKHVGTMTAHCTKVEKLEFVPDFDDDKQEPQTGWRFLGFDDDVYYGDGEFNVGTIYQIARDRSEMDKLCERADFIDDNNVRMAEHLKYFEEVNPDDCQYPDCGCPELRLCMATGKKMGE